MARNKTDQVLSRAYNRIPGGVNSPVRSWKAVGGTPRVIQRGKGAYLVDLEGKKYLDYLGSWGPLILGHADQRILIAVNRAAAKGTTFGAPTEAEVELAEMVHARVPSIEKLRLVSSGTEATMSAVRLARAYTQRDKIVKFDGCYHGHADWMLARAGSGLATLSVPDSPGVPAGFTKETLVARYNDVGQVESLLREYPDSIAAIIVEPVCGNMGVIPPASNFLQTLRKVTRDHGVLLIFDEVITGFRVAPGGAQEFYGVTPDLTCLGKVLGGGLPLGAFGGRQEIMDLVAPQGPVYQAGTLSGNPLAVAAGITTLQALKGRGVYGKLEERGKRFQQGVERVLARYQVRGVVNRVGSMLTLFFGVDQVRNADEARSCDRDRFARFFHGMLERGVYLPPSPFETAFISLAHSAADIAKTLRGFEDWARSESKPRTTG